MEGPIFTFVCSLLVVLLIKTVPTHTVEVCLVFQRLEGQEPVGRQCAGHNFTWRLGCGSIVQLVLSVGKAVNSIPSTAKEINII
jgi:hypothetical protein